MPQTKQVLSPWTKRQIEMKAQADSGQIQRIAVKILSR